MSTQLGNQKVKALSQQEKERRSKNTVLSTSEGSLRSVPVGSHAPVSNLAIEAGTVKEISLLNAYWASIDPVTDASMQFQPPSKVTQQGVIITRQEVIIDTDNRVPVVNTKQYPWCCIASLVITAADNSQWIGSAWLVAPGLLLTAGHCVYMVNHGGWAKEIRVIPGRMGSTYPFGSCVATDFRSVQGWVENNDREYDYAAILLPKNCRYGDDLGWFGFEVRGHDALENLDVNLSGYPGDKSGTQWFDSNIITTVDERVITYKIDSVAGHSGGPVWVTKPDGGRYGVGIHTNGAVTGNSATRIIQEVFDNISNWKLEAL